MQLEQAHAEALAEDTPRTTPLRSRPCRLDAIPGQPGPRNPAPAADAAHHGAPPACTCPVQGTAVSEPDIPWLTDRSGRGPAAGQRPHGGAHGAGRHRCASTGRCRAAPSAGIGSRTWTRPCSPRSRTRCEDSAVPHCLRCVVLRHNHPMTAANRTATGEFLGPPAPGGCGTVKTGARLSSTAAAPRHRTAAGVRRRAPPATSGSLNAPPPLARPAHRTCGGENHGKRTTTELPRPGAPDPGARPDPAPHHPLERNPSCSGFITRGAARTSAWTASCTPSHCPAGTPSNPDWILQRVPDDAPEQPATLGTDTAWLPRIVLAGTPL